MDYSSDDSVEDPNFMPDFSDSNTAARDDDDCHICNPAMFSRRLSTFSDSDIHLHYLKENGVVHHEPTVLLLLKLKKKLPTW